MNAVAPSLSARWSAWTIPLRARWQALNLRERRLVAATLAVVVLFLLWTVALQPALRTLREAPAKLDALDAELQQMRLWAAEAQELRSTAPLSSAQSAAALKAATERLGERGRLTLQAERGVLTLTNATPTQLRDWLAEARSAARARPIEVQLTRSGTGFSGTVVVALGGLGG
jgi:general secretion pathway protein M